MSSVRLQRTMQIACVLRSVLIAYLITLSLENEIIVFWKKFWKKSEIFIQISVPTLIMKI